MTVDFSVLFWTLVNFILLMLVLKYLLFDPILKVIDARNAKIARAEDAEAKRVADGQRRIADAEAAAEAAAKQAAADADARLSEAKALREKAVSQAVACDKARVAQAKAELAEESGTIIEALKASVPSVTRSFAEILAAKDT